MSKEITSIAELVGLFGGSSKMAEFTALSPSAIWQWEHRDGKIPPSWHMRFAHEVERRFNRTIAPELFGYTGEVAEFMRAKFCRTAEAAA